MLKKKHTTDMPSEIRSLLAPGTALRVGLYPGSPNSFIAGVTPEQNKGVGYELGQAFAKRLRVEFQPVFFKMNGDVLAAAKENQIDFLLANATPVRAKFLAFTEPVLQIEQGYLVGAHARVERADLIDQPEIRIGVSAGSTTQTVLPQILKKAKLIAIQNLQDAADKMRSGELHAFATNKAILFELSDQLEGSRVIEGAWGIENISIGIPLSRYLALPWVQSFADDMKKSLFIQQAANRAGLRGLTKDLS